MFLVYGYVWFVNPSTRVGLNTCTFYSVPQSWKVVGAPKMTSKQSLSTLSCFQLVELAKFIPVHSSVLSSYLFFCLPLLLFPITELCTYRLCQTGRPCLSFRFFTKVRSSSKSPMAALIFLQTSSLITWSLYEMFSSFR